MCFVWVATKNVSLEKQTLYKLYYAYFWILSITKKYNISLTSTHYTCFI